jgi:hypothetical protein
MPDSSTIPVRFGFLFFLLTKNCHWMQWDETFHASINTFAFVYRVQADNNRNISQHPSTMDNLAKACKQLQNNDWSLSLLNLSNEGIGSEGMRKLSKSCISFWNAPSSNGYHTVHSPLVVLWLENNYIYPKGAEALAEVLSASPSLRYIYMAHNWIDNSGVTALSSIALRQLEVFNLAYNEIGPVGARSMAHHLRDEHSSTLRTLILESNHLGDEGAICIADSLKANTTLIFLDLRYNEIRKDGLMGLRDALIEDNKTLEFLLLEEEDDSHCHPLQTKPPRRRPGHTLRPSRLLLKNTKRHCSCERCKIRAEIDYYLALNRAGRHSFGDVRVSASLWPRIMGHVSDDEPSLLYAMLSVRPDVAMSTPMP